jgi:outer membrane lipopolysaccharide assembly protein LptE/RlpB
VPVFATRTVLNGMETPMTEAVIREFATRTRLRVTPKTDENSDAVLHGTILKEAVTPLTYNTATQQSSSYLITVMVSVTVNDRDGKMLYQNQNYVYRQQYQATTNLPTFLEEDPAAVQRLSSDFARQLVADVLEGF